MACIKLKAVAWSRGIPAPSPAPKTACPKCGRPDSAIKGYWCVDCVVKLLDAGADEKRKD